MYYGPHVLGDFTPAQDSAMNPLQFRRHHQSSAHDHRLIGEFCCVIVSWPPSIFSPHRPYSRTVVAPLLTLQERGEVILKYCLALFEPGKRLLRRSCIPTSGFESVDDTALSGNDPSTVTHVAARHGEFILYGRAL
jgi:hypothetical protein